MKDIYKEFISFMGDPIKFSDVSEKEIKKYEKVFMGPKDEVDIITEIWKTYGYCSYRNGLFSTINPEEYNVFVKKFPSVSNDAIAFAKSASGCFFLWDKFNFGWAISHLNIHTGKINILGSNFDMLFEWNLTSENFWREDCYGDIELEIVKNKTSLELDECLTFIPALILGGEEKVSNMQKVKVKENLELLAQFHKKE